MSKESRDSGYPNYLLRAIGKKWVLLILSEVEKSKVLRFNQIRSIFPKINSSTLSSILKELESLGLIEKKIHDIMPLKVEYKLTQSGKTVVKFARPLMDFKNSNHSARYSKGIESTFKNMVSVAVEHALLEMGTPELEKVESRLQEDYHCTIADTAHHPEYLKRILSELFGNSYQDILDTIHSVLKESESQEMVKNFLMVLEK